MKEFLIVDGYNIVNSWPELVELKSKSFAHAREKLVDILLDFQGFTGAKTIVVFDAGNVKDATETWESVGDITVIFTQHGETADGVIERLVGQMPAGSTVYVATSDWAEQRIIFGRGGYRLSSRDLYERVQKARRYREKYFSSGAKDSPKLDASLDEHTKDTLEKLRRSK